MKKNTLSGVYFTKNPRFKQIFRTMRISTFLLMAGALCSYAENAHSQNVKVSLQMNQVKLDKVLDEIENQTDYLFIYNNQVNTNKVTSVNAKNETVAKVLDKMLDGTGIRYELAGEHIILTTETTPTTSVAQQTNTITGQVVDTNGESIIGANVRIKGTTIGTITDLDGKFTLDADSKAIIEISYIGYLTQDIALNGKKTLRCVLKEDTKTLDEVVVVGYGVQKKADLTGSVANIGADKLTTQSNTNIGQALQGKIAGVDIVSQGGAPGSGVRIMVRGIGTLNNASPLYIVDGMYMGSIDHLNPNDIESIDVLKDASSAAIYGSRAANGVIIVTTKSGSNTEGKPIIDVSANIGLQTPSKYLDMLNAEDWARLTTESRKAIEAKPLEMSQNMKEDNDWQDIMMGPALIQNYNLTVRGGTKYFTYYTGLGYINQDGTIKGTNFERFNAQFKSEYKRGFFTFGNNVVFSAYKDNPLYGYARGGYIGIILQSIPSLQKFDPENDKGGYGKVYGDATDIPNPLGILDENLTQRKSNTYNAYINLYAELKLPFGLKYRLNATPDFSFDRNTAYENIFDFGLRNNMVSNMQEYRYNRNNFLIENLLSFDKTFGKHKVTALLGYSFQEYHSRYIMASGKGLPNGIHEVGAATKDRMNHTEKKESAMTSIISRVFYSYQYFGKFLPKN